MPLPLPPGSIVVPAISGADEALQGPRVTDFRFELLDHAEHQTGILGTVTGGSIDWVSRTAIHGGGQLDVADPGYVPDWLNVRIRPVVIYSRADTPPIQERTLGVFLTAAPVEAWTETGRTWQVELLDKLSILDRDIVTDGNGDPVTYSVAAGANVITTVRTLIEDTGETTQAILDASVVLASPMTWDLGTARLKIINDLLDAGNFTSLWTDAAGQFQARPFVAPEDRAPVYSLLAPFEQGASSLMAPAWSVDRDIYEVPNRYVAITSGSGDTPAMTSVAENRDSNSPFSYANRGNQWVTRVLTNAEAADQDALDAIARRGLTSTTSVAAVITVANAYLPDLLMNATVWFRNQSAGLWFVAEVNKLTVPLDPLELCKTELLEVLGTSRPFPVVVPPLKRVNSYRSTRWAVLSELTQVTSTRATSWSVLARVTSSRHTEWDVESSLTTVTSTRHTEWAVLVTAQPLTIEKLGTTPTYAGTATLSSLSVTVAVGDLVAVVVSVTGGAGATGDRTIADIATSLGGSWTWHLELSAPGAATSAATYVFWAIVPSGGGGTGTFTFTAGANVTHARVSVVRVQHQAAVSPVVGAAVLTTTASASGSITVGEAPTVDDMLVGFFTSRNDTNGMTEGADFTLLANLFGATPSASQMIEHRTGTTSTTVDVSNMATVANNGVGFVVKGET